jgi:hypothetical protein
MTICPGGLTQAKPGVAAFVNYGSSAAGLLSLVPRLAALAPAAYVLSGVSIATSVLCGSEPPAMPTFNQTEINDILNNNFIDSRYATALGKLKDMNSNLAWYQLCECQSGGAVTLPTPPVQPTPPLVVPTNLSNASVLCAGNFPGSFRHWSAVGGGYINSNWNVQPLPAGAVQEHVKMATQANGLGTQSTTSGHVDRFNAGGGHILVENFTIPLVGTFERWYPVDPVYPQLVVSATPDDGFGTGTDVNKQGEVYCTSGPATGPLNCCPPDPQVIGRLDNIQALVTLLQRQLAPFAYIAGTVHSGLSGAGVLSVQGLLGAKIHITTDPTTLGVEGPSPSILFDRGFITWGTADGYPQSERLERSTQLSLPARASAFTSLAYDLHPGVVVTITELVREP